MQKYILIVAFWAFQYLQLAAQTLLSGTLACNTTLSLSGSPYLATSDIIVAPGCTLTVSPGVEIKMAENTHLIIKGQAGFLGSPAQPIHIHAQDTIWGNIFLDSTLTQKSRFDYVIIENARYSVSPTHEPGAIYGYYSALEVTHCIFKNNLRCIACYECPGLAIKKCLLDSTNKGEKILGQYCHGAVIDSSILYWTHGDSDGIDFDASNNIRISGNQLYGGDDDGIDIGQCDSVGCDTVSITNNLIMRMYNKGISNGEYCKNIFIARNVIAGCALGIGVKSGAEVVADHNTLYQNRMGINAYHHETQIWGPGHLTVTNSIIANCDTTFHADSTAYLFVAYTLSPDTLIPGPGNLVGNPAFVAPGLSWTADFNLSNTSAAIDAGDPAFTPDPDGTRSDMGAFWFPKQATVSSHESVTRVTMFPNPSEGQIHIKIEEQSLAKSVGAIHLRIVNVTGEITLLEDVYAEKNEADLSLDLSYLSAGVYCIQLITDTATIVRKVVLN